MLDPTDIILLRFTAQHQLLILSLSMTNMTKEDKTKSVEVFHRENKAWLKRNFKIEQIGDLE